MVEPYFKMLWGSKIPKLLHRDSKGQSTEVEVIAGKLMQHVAPPPDSWAADPANEVAIFNMKLDVNAVFTLTETSEGINRVLYFYTGTQISLAGKPIEKYHSIVVNAAVDLEIINGAEEAKILVLQGRPIKEIVIQYGSFVMNTKEEIHQAFEVSQRSVCTQVKP